jgi:hypothetical protein
MTRSPSKLTALRLSGSQHSELMSHLFPGDGREAVAVALCGRSGDRESELLCVNHLELIPYSDCSYRDPDRVTWKTSRLLSLRDRAMKHGLGVLKIHSHPGGWPEFSAWDDASDRELFPGIYAWTDTDRPHASAILLPDGRIVARVVDTENEFVPIKKVTVTGSTIRQWSAIRPTVNAEYHQRTLQAFGEGTAAALSQLSVGVVGCSGTGSWVVEMLNRLGVRELVLVDPDTVEPVNLNRIVHATADDAIGGVPKVEVLRRAVLETGLGTRVEVHRSDVRVPAILKRLAHCDLLFGCVDSIEARNVLNRLAVYYLLPYFDVGVRLVADGHGGIDHIAGGVQYVHPDSPTLIERGLYTPEDLAETALRESDPVEFASQQERGYVRGVVVTRPAVASVNAFYASLAVNELLERIHRFRDESPVGIMVSLTQLRFVTIEEATAPTGLSRHAGEADVAPFLGMPFLTSAT